MCSVIGKIISHLHPFDDPMPICDTRHTERQSSHPGFTLIELIVVVFLISLMLFLAVPRFGSTLFTDSGRKATLWITATIHHLKEKAVREQADYRLHVDLDENLMWISREGMSDEDLDGARRSGYRFTDSLTLMDVALPNTSAVTSGVVFLRFNKKGYSSMAVIHVEDRAGKRLSFDVQPFLAAVRLTEGYLEYEQ